MVGVRKTSVYLTDDEAEALRAQSRATGRPQAELIREGIHAVLGHRPEQTFHSLRTGHGGGAERPRWDADELLRRRTGRRR